ncbi:HAD family hydrolase [Halalkalicoccus jeotgali]|uniref:Haloacid dehalogenase domain protein hydrolase n=1 Tax=Halalkalicoccus jeotgali (strain DSM 18796 / CECT 7217 / JCM 14584 / KCTC 4019 / B3) TaxID=795797 RepID=D8JA88_HALJB|nr:HAD family hydrolase [Halalkalicoccus jeotgali]ADJ14610.1 Haloacid dehalogenase domain protein hydrolase [Halalkalicoccus jeotgali B3]ELY39983.1 Haloacid dehalogenase domain-containing protein hydrolase [Halalkalicoccus jeotgali B3]
MTGSASDSDYDYDFWLLDLDGTLVDVEWPYVRETFDRVGERLGRRFTDTEARGLWYGLGANREAQIAALGLDREPFWAAFDAVETPAERVEATRLYEDAGFVADLEGPVGLVTHCRPDLTEPVLDRLDITDWFDTVVCCSDELGWKPDPTPVERAIGDLGAEGRGVLAGDGANDVGAAWNAGLDAIHVERHGTDSRGVCVLGDHRVRSFSELELASAPDAR